MVVEARERERGHFGIFLVRTLSGSLRLHCSPTTVSGCSLGSMSQSSEAIISGDLRISRTERIEDQLG